MGGRQERVCRGSKEGTGQLQAQNLSTPEVWTPGGIQGPLRPSKPWPQKALLRAALTVRSLRKGASSWLYPVGWRFQASPLDTQGKWPCNRLEPEHRKEPEGTRPVQRKCTKLYAAPALLLLSNSIDMLGGGATKAADKRLCP